MAPERQLIRRIAPWSLPTAVVAFGLGTWIGGADAGWSALIAVAVVFANFIAHGWSLALAAAISPTVLFAVGLGGFVVRLGVVIVVIALLEQTAWFSVVAFIAALVPTTVALLAVEMKMLSGRLQADLWTLPSTEREITR